MKGRRFIAGAVCPRCARLDTIYVYQTETESFRACVECDFKEAANFDAVKKELPTRVNQTVDPTVIEIQKIKIVDNKK